MSDSKIMISSAFSIPEGWYELDRDVANPAADRRYKRDFAMASIWRKGTRIKVSYMTREYDEIIIKYARIEAHGFSGRIVECDIESKSQVQAIVEALGKPIEDFDSVLRDAPVSAAEILHRLFVEGRVTLDELRDVATRAYDALGDD